MSADANHPDITYEVELSREPSTDFLEDARGAILQAQIEQLALDLRAEGHDLSISYRFGPGTIHLVVSSPDPAELDRFAHTAMSSQGYELPDPDHRLGHSPEAGERSALHEELKGTSVSLSVEGPLALRLANAIADLMRGTLISATTRNDLKFLAQDLQRKAFRAARQRD